MPQKPDSQLKSAISEPNATDLSAIVRKLLAAFSGECRSDPAVFARYVQKEVDFLAAALAAASPAPVDGTPYSRKIIYSGPEGESMVAHWPAGSICLPHDHADAWGAVLVLEGLVYEQGFSLSQDLKAAGPERSYPAGSAIMVRPGGIHNMRAEPSSITLHLYSPPIREMKVYDQTNHVIYTVAGECGAWIPREPHLILRREAFDRDPLHHEIPRGR